MAIGNRKMPVTLTDRHTIREQIKLFTKKKGSEFAMDIAAFFVPTTMHAV
jgi:hypothetical protein